MADTSSEQMLLDNQKTILANQKTIESNQHDIKVNQEQIKSNRTSWTASWTIRRPLSPTRRRFSPSDIGDGDGPKGPALPRRPVAHRLHSTLS